MSTVNSCTITNPYGKTDECAQFTIDNLTTVFTLNDTMVPDQDYTFSLWIKSESEGSVIVGGSSFVTSTEWAKHTATFKASSTDLYMLFGTMDTYYIYHPQLEIGTLATDWSPAPEDVENDITNAQNSADEAQNAANNNAENIAMATTTIQQLAESISMLVRDGNGGSLIQQDSSGLWYFNISDLEQSLSDTANGLNNLEGIVLDANGQIDVLQSTAQALQARTEYVRSYTDENDQPCLELGEGDSVFKVRITNTEIQFAEGTDVPTRINRKMLIIEKAMVRNELQFGDDEETDISGVWIWKRRSNGNLGLVWKGVNS